MLPLLPAELLVDEPLALALPPEAELPPLVDDAVELPATLNRCSCPPRVRTTTVRVPLPLKLRVWVVAKLPLADPKPACTGWFAVTVTVVQPFWLVVVIDAASAGSVGVVVTATVIVPLVAELVVVPVELVLADDWLPVPLETEEEVLAAPAAPLAAALFGSTSVVATGAGS